MLQVNYINNAEKILMTKLTNTGVLTPRTCAMENIYLENIANTWVFGHFLVCFAL